MITNIGSSFAESVTCIVQIPAGKNPLALSSTPWNGSQQSDANLSPVIFFPPCWMASAQAKPAGCSATVPIETSYLGLWMCIRRMCILRHKTLEVFYNGYHSNYALDWFQSEMHSSIRHIALVLCRRQASIWWRSKHEQNNKSMVCALGCQMT